MNECNLTGYLQCDPVTNFTDMNISPSYTQMTDNADGTYTTQYTPTVNGTATIIAYLLTPGKAFVQFYADKIFTPPAVMNETWATLNQDWNTGIIFNTRADNISASVYFLIKVPETAEYTFTLLANDGADLYANNTIQIQQLGVTCNCSSSFSMNLTVNKYINFK